MSLHRDRRGAFGRSRELLGLDRQQWQRDGTDPVDLEQRRQKLGRAGDEKVAGPANRSQHGGEVGCDGYQVLSLFISRAQPEG